MAARAARVLHLAAALFAIGALAGLYVRGLVFEYRVGWESTFLDAPAVRDPSLFLSPAAQLIGVPFPSVDQIAALRSPTARLATPMQRSGFIFTPSRSEPLSSCRASHLRS